MTREEIQTYLNVGSTRSISVDISLIDGLPNMVRQVSIRHPYQVNIEYYSYGYDEAPLHSHRDFSTLNEAVIFLEHYLGRIIETWENFNKTGNYPERTGNEPKTVQYTSWKELKAYLETLIPVGFSHFR